MKVIDFRKFINLKRFMYCRNVLW